MRRLKKEKAADKLQLSRHRDAFHLRPNECAAMWKQPEDNSQGVKQKV